KGRNEFDGKFGANLGLADTDELLFVTMVDLDVPTPEVVLNDGLKRQIRIGADQIGGLAVKQAALFSEAIPQGANNDQSQQPMGAGFAPLDGSDRFIFTVVVLAGGPDPDFAPRNALILEQRFGCGSSLAITSAAATAGLLGRRIKELGVFPNATNEGRACR